VLLSHPSRILAATRPEEVTGLLAEIEAEQLAGRYVAGYLAYEAGAAFGLTVRPGSARALPAGCLSCDDVPLAWMAVYPPESAVLVPASEWSRYLDAIDISRATRVLSRVTPELNVTRDEYAQAIARVREYIAAGDTYQVNYTVRARYDLGSTRRGGSPEPPGTEPREPDRGGLDPLEYFLALAVRQSVPYAAFLDLGGTQVISLSPELFLRREGERLESRPMKGTRPRGTTPSEDTAFAYELAETEKERAENLMIVDMVRNDLGRVCRTGSIHVPALYVLEPYRTVWQMTSTVQGLLQPGTSLSDIFRAVFPGASITGAPKHHTMEIIAEMETEPRGAYTGTIALFSPGGDFTGNIGIRTILHRGGRCTLGVGSGIVWDARAPAEYEETLAKAAFALAPPSGEWRRRAAATTAAAAATPPSRAAAGGTAARGGLRALPPGDGGASTAGFRLFETLLLDAGGCWRYLEEHLARMAGSAQAFGFPFNIGQARSSLAELAASNRGPLAVRLDLAPSGNIEPSTREAPEEPAGPVTLLVSPIRVDPEEPLLRHKTTQRDVYDREHRRAIDQGCFDALFVNRLDNVTEGAITSVFARFGDAWVTPPLTDGLLPGIWRAAFAQEKGAAAQSVTFEELVQADEIVVGNSVRGAVAVARLAADPLTF
jgi:para-aminobenzoate synthetase/4-amino-4-deoxychorismate lyase